MHDPVRPHTLAFVAFLSLLCSACIAPYSDFHGARLVGQGRAELTPFYSAVWFHDDGETEKIQDHFGVNLATGISDRADLRFRFERVTLEGEGLNVLGGGPKFSLVTDRLALFTPVGTAFGEDVESSEFWQIQPTLLFTAMPGPTLEVNASTKMLFWLKDGADNLVAFNLGLGVRPGEGSLWFRPEAGYLFNPGESGGSFHLGVGLSVVTGGR